VILRRRRVEQRGVGGHRSRYGSRPAHMTPVR
jgi:hypothetical protein